MTFDDYISVLRARWPTIAWTFSITVSLAVVLSLLIPNHYKAITTVVPDLRTSDPLDSQALPNGLVPSYSGTQIDIIESDRVIRNVIDRLRLRDRPEIVEKWRQSLFYTPDNFDAWAVRWLKRKVTIDPPRDSSVIEISFSYTDPQFAVDTANAFADAYLQANLELNVEPAQNSARWFDELTKPLRANLAAAQEKLSAFQQQHGIVATDDRIDVETTHLSELEQQLVTAQGMRADSASRQNHTERAPDSLTEVLQNPLITSLRAEIARDQAELDDLRGRLGTSHPQYVSMQAQIASLQAREAAEVSRVVGSLGTNNRVSIDRENQLRLAIESQKARVLDLRGQHDQAAVLQRDVDSAQRAYDLVTQRLAESTLEGQLRQTNVSILSRATLPYRQSWPVLWIDAAVAIFVGALLGLGLALLREHLDTRLHSTEQMAELTGMPALFLTISHVEAANEPEPGERKRRRIISLFRRTAGSKS
jgi:chain length determinant protein EpsF